jgi:hypothetical protein
MTIVRLPVPCLDTRRVQGSRKSRPATASAFDGRTPTPSPRGGGIEVLALSIPFASAVCVSIALSQPLAKTSRARCLVLANAIVDICFEPLLTA